MSLETRSLSELKAIAKSLGIPEPEGHKGFKKTWVQAIQVLKEDSKLAHAGNKSSSDSPSKAPSQHSCSYSKTNLLGFTKNIIPSDSPKKSTQRENTDIGQEMQEPSSRLVRDQYACPITRDLMKDPVTAEDGHTYERSAIEMWLKNQATSPITDQEIGNVLIPNDTLKRLIECILKEGGEGLYLPHQGGRDVDSEDDEYMLELRCVHLEQNDWSGKSFWVGTAGAVGGKEAPYLELGARGSMVFSDSMVSRRHFEVFFQNSTKRFCIRDLGSTNGTFLRIPYGVPLPLQPGLVFKVGNHQFIVKNAEVDSSEKENRNPQYEPKKDVLRQGAERKRNHQTMLSKKKFRGWNRRETMNRTAGSMRQSQENTSFHLPSSFTELLDRIIAQGRYKYCSSIELECIAPEESPLKGENFRIGPDGATLGRELASTISFSLLQAGGFELVGMDGSISGQHARIEYENGHFFLYDGQRGKSSTNGTWLRLSPTNMPSTPFPLDDSIEVMIGLNCFQVSIHKPTTAELMTENAGVDVFSSTSSRKVRKLETERKSDGAVHMIEQLDSEEPELPIFKAQMPGGEEAPSGDDSEELEYSYCYSTEYSVEYSTTEDRHASPDPCKSDTEKKDIVGEHATEEPGLPSYEDGKVETEETPGLGPVKAGKGEAAEWRAAAQAQEARAETLAGQLAQAEDEAARAREHADREAGALAAAREAGAARALELGELGLRAERLEEDLAKAQARLEAAAAEHAAETAELGAAHAEEAADLRARLAEQTQRAESAEEELAAVAGVRDELQAKSADLGAQVLRLESDNRQNAAAAAHKEEVAGGLRADLAAARRQLEDKGKEYQLLLAGLATAQQAAAEREEELRAGRRAAEERALAAEAGRAAAAAEAGRLRAEGAARGAELAALREAAAALQARAEGAEARAGAAEGAARASAAALAVEGELRARAEAREGEERSERAAATAQLLAQEQGHRAELDRVGGAARARAAEDARQLAAQRDRAEALANEVAEEKTAAAGLAAEIESLKTALAEAAQSTAASAEHLAEVALLRGELERARRRGDEMASLREADRGAQANRAEEAEAKAAALERERRRLHNLVQELRGNVRVLVRVRPFLPGDGRAEAEGAGAGNRWGVARCHPDGARLSLEHEVTRTGREGERSVGEAQAFAFDKVLAPSVGQEGVFAEVADLVQSALDGFDVCIFAYGQTGSGKTHTMQGARQGPLQGVIPRAVAQLGAAKARLEEEGWAFRMEATFLEIYNEQVRDLLVAPAEARERKYEVKLGKDGQPHVAGLEHAPIDPTDAEAIEQLMETANRNRSIAKTDMNEHSSRSHSVFTLHIHASNERMGADFDGKLHLVDLAGSERVDRSNAKGQQLKEAQAINSSLASLADVFHALGNRQAHVPFRNSKLTHLLQPALSGDGKTLMIVNCAPTAASYQETLCSLRFASKVNKCELGRPKKHLRQHRRSIVDSSKVGGNAKRKASGQSS